MEAQLKPHLAFINSSVAAGAKLIGKILEGESSGKKSAAVTPSKNQASTPVKSPANGNSAKSTPAKSPANGTTPKATPNKSDSAKKSKKEDKMEVESPAQKKVTPAKAKKTPNK